MLRIQLIRPNAALRSTYLPIGLGYIAAAARAAGHRVRILDARLERLEMAETMARIREFAPDVLGLTAVHEAAEKKAVLALAERFKKTGGRAPIVLGGPLVSTSGAAMVASGLIEAAFLGEGEETFVRYLHILESGGDPAEVPGIFYARDGCVRQTPTAPLVEDVDHLRVAWDLLQPQRYFTLSGRSSQSIIKRSHRCVPLFTSRGCPFGCIYCHNIFGRRFRPRTPEAG
ncbi:MAG: B12-binding domain-containing radical SAM protein, partial [Desulfosudaceae bacterium]